MQAEAVALDRAYIKIDLAGGHMNTHAAIRIGDVELDVERYELRRAGQRIRLERLPMELLIFMASRGGELVTRADIVRVLWSGNAFRDTDNSINTAIRKIRIALGENPDHPKYLLTIKGKGYRLDGARTLTTQPLAAVPAAVRVLVLPFENKSGDPTQDKLCDALADETSANIGMLHPEQIYVIARTTAAGYRGSNKSIAQMAHELTVDHVLEGSLTREGGRVRILAQLIRGTDQAQIWSCAYEPAAHAVATLAGRPGSARRVLARPVLLDAPGSFPCRIRRSSRAERGGLHACARLLRVRHRTRSDLRAGVCRFVEYLWIDCDTWPLCTVAWLSEGTGNRAARPGTGPGSSRSPSGTSRRALFL